MYPVAGPFDAEVKLRMLSVDANGTYYFHVGTEEEAEQFYRRR